MSCPSRRFAGNVPPRILHVNRDCPALAPAGKLGCATPSIVPLAELLAEMRALLGISPGYVQAGSSDSAASYRTTDQACSVWA